MMKKIQIPLILCNFSFKYILIVLCLNVLFWSYIYVIFSDKYIFNVTLSVDSIILKKVDYTEGEYITFQTFDNMQHKNKYEFLKKFSYNYGYISSYFIKAYGDNPLSYSYFLSEIDITGYYVSVIKYPSFIYNSLITLFFYFELYSLNI